MSVISINPSGDWYGNDGNWSTFVLRIGSESPQRVHILPSTSGSAIWAVDPQGCFPPEFTECPNLRGSTFNPNESTTWNRIIGSEQETAFNLSFAAESSLIPLGYSATGTVGLDNVQLGNEGPSPPLDNQVIEVYYDWFPFVGHLGLEVQNETIAGDAYQSVLGTLNSSNTIPSAYWAYTAGAHWLGTWASLTFGGYDKTRGDISEALKFPFSFGDQNFRVSIHSIKLRNSVGDFTAGGNFPVPSFIDSVVPEIWLDRRACDAFEDVYGLQWNAESGLYFLNDSQHEM
jgi:hypothetical protein